MVEQKEREKEEVRREMRAEMEAGMAAKDMDKEVKITVVRAIVLLLSKLVVDFYLRP